jgi:hypothetical protein
MSIQVLRGQGRISQWFFVKEVRQLYQRAVQYPTQNIWNAEANSHTTIPTQQAKRLSELESDNFFDLVSDKITKANEGMMDYITGDNNRFDYQLNRVINAMLGDEDSMNLVTLASSSPVFVGTKTNDPYEDRNITLYQYTGDSETPRMYKKSLKHKVLMTKDWAVKYLEWYSKNTQLIQSYNDHVKGLKAKQEVANLKRSLRHQKDKLIGYTQTTDDLASTLDDDITKYNAEQTWLARMPKHLLGDKPHILGLMNDPVVAIKNWRRAKNESEQAIR